MKTARSLKTGHCNLVGRRSWYVMVAATKKAPARKQDFEACVRVRVPHYSLVTRPGRMYLGEGRDRNLVGRFLVRGNRRYKVGERMEMAPGLILAHALGVCFGRRRKR